MSIQAVQVIADEQAEANTATPATPAAESKPTVVRVAKAKAADEAPSAPPIEKGKLFRWNGKGYEEIVFEDNQDRRVPMVEEAFQAAIEIRKQVQARLRMRPDLSIVASALVLAASKHPEVVDEVARYGLEMYAKAASGKA